MKTPPPAFPYPTLPLSADEPQASMSPEIGSDEVYIGCGNRACEIAGWDVSYLSADGHLWDAADQADDRAGFTVCNLCGRVYPNLNRYGGPMPTIARIDITTDAWLDALDLYDHRAFAAPISRPANIGQQV